MSGKSFIFSSATAFMIGVAICLGTAGCVAAQDNGSQQPSAREQLQRIHTPQSIDQELARLTKELELTTQQSKRVRPLLQEHHDRIQDLIDKNPKASRQQLAPQIHSISDDTHRKIHALLSSHQKDLEKSMPHRERNSGEDERLAPPPVSPSTDPSLLA
jgi:hypothetical protein